LTGAPPGARAAPSDSFGLLHEGVRRWIWRQGWDSLRDVQEEAIPLVLRGGRDVVISAGTASGKTEAAFLPVVSRLASAGPRAPGCGFEAVYVGPLRALINDQFRRVEGLCAELGVPVARWHGDVAASVKARAARAPSGVLLTTPESLEAILVRRGAADSRRLFRALGHVVVDEMHAFLDSPRGRQLQSLLARIDRLAAAIAPGPEGGGGRPPGGAVRIGLSATLADMGAAREFLRPGDPARVAVVDGGPPGVELRLQIRGVRRPRAAGDGDESEGDPAEAEIADHLDATLRGRRALVFAGSRQRVESFAVALSERRERDGAPDDVFAHHGSLSREHREAAEERLRDAPGQPATVVCTTTLELGIDVGDIDAVAQIGPGHTVSGVRQRLGRSGRRAGRPAVMRVYVAEADAAPGGLDGLRRDTVQAVATLSLLLRRWNEPPAAGRLHLSTLLHQILALVGQNGGASPADAWSWLAAPGRPFQSVGPDLFRALLRRMGDQETGLLEQAPDGTLLPGPRGERLLAAADFFPVFATPAEYAVVTDAGRNLGRLPLESPLAPDDLIVFAGRRWRVAAIDPGRREIVVARARGGVPPAFGGASEGPHEGVVREMRQVWSDPAAEEPPFLDAGSRGFLREGRARFAELGLGSSCLAEAGGRVALFPWCGGRALLALSLALRAAGVPDLAADGLCLSAPESDRRLLEDALRRLAEGPPPDGEALAAMVPDKALDRFDHLLGEPLLRTAFARDRLEAARVPEIARAALRGAG